MLREAEEILMDEQPILPFYVYTTSYMLKPFLKGLWPNYQDRHPWRYMWIDDRWYDGIPSTEVDNTPPPSPS